jgi:hypothetical protein
MSYPLTVVSANTARRCPSAPRIMPASIILHARMCSTRYSSELRYRDCLPGLISTCRTHCLFRAANTRSVIQCTSPSLSTARAHLSRAFPAQPVFPASPVPCNACAARQNLCPTRFACCLRASTHAGSHTMHPTQPQMHAVSVGHVWDAPLAAGSGHSARQSSRNTTQTQQSTSVPPCALIAASIMIKLA